MRNLYFVFILLSVIKGISQCTYPITYSVQVTPESCLFCCDGSAQVVNLLGGCTGPYTADWQPGNLFGMTVTNLCSGTYTVSVSDALGGTCCPVLTQTLIVPTNTATSINENYLENTLSVFPNPINSFLNIIDKQNEFQTSTIEIKNYLGQVVFSTPFIKQINISNIQSGIYFLTVQNSSIKKTVKIIKQ